MISIRTVFISLFLAASFPPSTSVAQDSPVSIVSTSSINITPGQAPLLGHGFDSVSNIFKSNTLTCGSLLATNGLSSVLLPYDSNDTNEFGTLSSLRAAIVDEDGGAILDTSGETGPVSLADVESTMRTAAASADFPQEISYDFQFSSNFSNLITTLDASISLDIGIGSFGASAYASLFKSLNKSSATSYIVFRMTVKNWDATLPDCELLAKTVNDVFSTTANATAQDAGPFSRFYQSYGDEFVRSITYGGELLSIFEVSGSTQREREKFFAEMSASFAGYASADASITTTEDADVGELDISLVYFKRGGNSSILTFDEQPVVLGSNASADVADSAKTYLRNLWDAAKVFPAEVRENPIPLVAHTISYSVIDDDLLREMPTTLFSKSLAQEFIAFTSQNEPRLNEMLREKDIDRGSQYCFVSTFGQPCVPILRRLDAINTSQACLDQTNGADTECVLTKYPGNNEFSLRFGVLLLYTDFVDVIYDLYANPFLDYEEWRERDNQLTVFKHLVMDALYGEPTVFPSDVADSGGQ